MLVKVDIWGKFDLLIVSLYETMAEKPNRWKKSAQGQGQRRGLNEIVWK